MTQRVLPPSVLGGTDEPQATSASGQPSKSFVTNPRRLGASLVAPAPVPAQFACGRASLSAGAVCLWSRQPLCWRSLPVVAPAPVLAKFASGGASPCAGAAAIYPYHSPCWPGNQPAGILALSPLDF